MYEAITRKTLGFCISSFHTALISKKQYTLCFTPFAICSRGMHFIVCLIIVLNLINILWNMPIVTKNRPITHTILRQFDSRALFRERLRIKKLAYRADRKNKSKI